jgi:hypothetical protein
MLSLDLVWIESGLGLDFITGNREQVKAKTWLVSVASVMRLLSLCAGGYTPP